MKSLDYVLPTCSWTQTASRNYCASTLYLTCGLPALYIRENSGEQVCVTHFTILIFPDFALRQQGPISWRDLSWASYHFVLDLSPQTDLSLFMKSAPGPDRQILWRTVIKPCLSVLGPARYLVCCSLWIRTTDYRKDWQKVKLCISYDWQRNIFWKSLIIYIVCLNNFLKVCYGV